MKVTQITKLALIATATAAATMALPATANADTTESDFQSPSGNISCEIQVVPPSPPVDISGNNIATCWVYDQIWAAPLLDGVSCIGGHGTVAPDPNNRLYRVEIDSNSPKAYLLCEGKGTSPPSPTLDYGQTRSGGPITCGSEQSGVTCRDSSTGHFFFVSRDSYQLG